MVTKKQIKEQFEALEDLLMFLEYAWKRGLAERDPDLVKIIDKARVHAAFLIDVPRDTWADGVGDLVLVECKEAFNLGAERLVWIDPAFLNKAYRTLEVE